MDMTGEFRIPASRQKVWEGLNDPDILKQCIPGCQSIEKVSDTEFTAKVTAKVGPVRATFSGKVNLSDLDPPNGYTIAGEGTGGVAGFAKGSAKVDLAGEGEDTVLKYAAHAQVGGKLAQIGSRLVDGTARRMAEQFFGAFAKVMGPEEAAGEGGGAGAPGSAARMAASGGLGAPRPDKPKSHKAKPARALPASADFRLPPAVWVGGLTVLIALMLYAFALHGAIR